MSKKIDAALDDLTKALHKHAKAVGGSQVRAKEVSRANAKLQAAATRYTSVVYKKTKTDTPFSDVPRPDLEEAILKSLAAERDALKASRG